MNLDEMKREIDRMLSEMNRGEMVAPSGNNKVALKQISDVLDELDRAIGSLRFLDHVAKRGRIGSGSDSWIARHENGNGRGEAMKQTHVHIIQDADTKLFGIGAGTNGLVYESSFTRAQAEFVLGKCRRGLTFEEILIEAERAGVDMTPPV